MRPARRLGPPRAKGLRSFRIFAALLCLLVCLVLSLSLVAMPPAAEEPQPQPRAPVNVHLDSKRLAGEDTREQGRKEVEMSSGTGSEAEEDSGTNSEPEANAAAQPPLRVSKDALLPLAGTSDGLAREATPPSEEDTAREGDSEAGGRRGELPGLPVIVDGMEDVVGSGDILLLHQGRCGSTALLELFGQQGNRRQILLAPWREFMSASRTEYEAEPTEELAEAVRQELQEKTQAVRSHRKEGSVLLSMKFSHICGLEIPVRTFLEVAYSVGYRHLIILHRSYLRVALSMAKVHQKHLPYHAKQETSCEDVAVTLGGYAEAPVPFKPVQMYCRAEPSEEPLLDMFAFMEEGYRAAVRSTDLFPDQVLLSYERDIYEDPLAAYSLIAERLGTSGIHLVPEEELNELSLRKTSDCPLAAMLEGEWEAMRARLDGSKWAWMLQDVPVIQSIPGMPMSLIV